MLTDRQVVLMRQKLMKGKTQQAAAAAGSIDEAEADERQDTAGRSGGIGHEREVGAELE